MDEAFAIATDLCKQFEGFRAAPYRCAAGVPTIGYGATYYMDGSLVQLTDPPITREVATGLLLFQLEKQFFPGVIRLCPILITHPTKLAAIADFAFNLGLGRLQTSTLRRKVNAGDWTGSKEQLMRWTRASGKILPGLVRRRSAECNLL